MTAQRNLNGSSTLHIALRLAYETMTAIEIATRLDYCEQSAVLTLLDQVDHIAAMIVKLTRNIPAHPGTKTVREVIAAYIANPETDPDD